MATKEEDIEPIDVEEYEQHPEVDLLVIKDPETAKQRTIVDSLFKHISDLSYDGNIQKFTRTLIDSAYSDLKRKDINTQKAYVWQVFGKHVHLVFSDVEAETELAEREHLVDFIHGSSEEECKWIKRGIDISEEELRAFRVGHRLSQIRE